MIQDFKNKNIAVLGYGVEGTSIVEFLQKEGAAQITVFSEKENQNIQNQLTGIHFQYGPFPDLSSFDSIIRSPGIRPDIGVLQNGQTQKKVTTATNIFFERCPCPIIGITGTKGKGTTSTLIYEMLKRDNSKRMVFLGGNIGIPALSFLNKLTKDSYAVLELSSFQLMDCQYSPHIAVFLMTVPEHQDWHSSLEEYLTAKTVIFSHQKQNDTLVINTDYSLNRSLLRDDIAAKILSVSTMPHDHPGVYVSNRNVFIYQSQFKKQRIFSTAKLKLPGKHNWENAAAAIAAAKAVGVKTAAIQHVLETFTGLPYRLEKVAEINGTTYYNDSFSTTPETAIAAIKAFDQPKILILGGSSKNSDFTELGNSISTSSSIKAIIGIGVEWARIKDRFNNQELGIKIIEGCSNMKEVILAAKDIAQPGDVVLLSPGCASFGMFENYKDRGNQFKTEVMKLL